MAELNRALSHGNRARRERRATIVMSVLGAGAVAVGVSVMSGTYLPWGVILALAIPTAIISFWAADVNEGLSASSTVMIFMAAGSLLAIAPESSATLGLMILAGLAPLQRVDVVKRRIQQPLWNLGQLLISGVAAGVVFDHNLTADTTTWGVVAVSAAAVAVYMAVNFGLVYAIARYVYETNMTMSWQNSFSLFGSNILMGLVGGLIGFAATNLNQWLILPLLAVQFVVSHQEFITFSKLRDSHQSTLSGFIRTLEAKDFYTRGHSERVAYFARITGEHLRMSGRTLTDLTTAALCHDLGKASTPKGILRAQRRLTEEEWEIMRQHDLMLGSLVEGIDFLERATSKIDGHHLHHSANPDRPIEADIVSACDAFDAMTSTRPYRAALSQDYAFAELRKCAGTQFNPVVVEAFIAAVTSRGERYGNDEMNSDDDARDVAESASRPIPEAALNGESA